jgi:putative ATP-dependent endonuclease of OLD family
MDSSSEGVEITPFTKKIRDLNKGLSIYYSDKKESFPMEYHGMGTRSWSSLLTLKSFINLLGKNAEKEQTPFSPILAIEEPEAHLHPNAQKKLYRQIAGITGQKIISTHSPYIAASAELNLIRNFYKNNETVACGEINTDELSAEDIRKIKRQVINTRGELFFSKAIVYFEGETEEQALPIFAEHYFKKTPVEMGIDFIGVGGHGNYLPFLRVAESLKIPWFIFSDAEEYIKKSVNNQFADCHSDKIDTNVIIFLNDGNNFENQLITDGFSDEIKSAILTVELSKCHSSQHETAKKTEIEGYDDEKLYQILNGSKTQYAAIIAETIVERNVQLPPKVTDLFMKIKISLERRYLFSWNEIPGSDSERLIEFLKQNFDINWVKKEHIKKSVDLKTIKVSTDKKFICIRLNDDEKIASLEIDDGRTDEFITETENGKLNIYGRRNADE